MLLRRSLPVVAALAAAACAKGVPQDVPPSSLGYAMFDVSAATPVIPLPNDLALQQSSIEKFPASAQRDLLQGFKDSGGFPNDQEVAVTIPFTKVNINADTGATTREAPDLDLTSITATSLVVLKGATPATYTVAGYQKDTGTGIGTLTLRNVRVAKPAATPPVTELVGAPWDAGATYIVAVRGGASGVKFTGGQTVSAQFTFSLLLGGKALNDPANQSIIPGTAEEKAAAGAQLEVLRQSYATPFAAVDGQFDHTELAVLATFKIAPTAAPHVETDPNRGLIPLPSDLMLAGVASKPDGSLNPNLKVQVIDAFGPLKGGIATLDGFTTSGMILSQMSGAILADTVNKDSVFIYDLTDPTAPVRVKDATEGAGAVYVSEPSPITQTVGGARLSTAIGLQPAIPVPTGNAQNPLLTLPPFKDGTTYAVLISTKVKGIPTTSATPPAITRSTLGNILLFPPEHLVATADGKSLLSGVPDATASAVEGIRRLLHPAIAKAIADTKIASRDDLAMAYTFRTQTVVGRGYLAEQAAGVASPVSAPGLLQFAAIPYKSPAGTLLFNPVIDPTFTDATHAADPTLGVYTPAEAWTKWGIDASAPNDQIQEVIHASTFTFNLLDPTTGAFNPAGPTPEPIKLLIVVPKPANTPACYLGTGSPFPAGARCARLVVFHHGLGGSKSAMLLVANELAAKGMVVVSYDGAKHGDRSWCASSAQCASGGTCAPITGAATQGDAVAPGICTKGPLKAPTNCSTAACVQAWGGWTAGHPTDPGDGYSVISSQYVVSANFFRARDTLRQDLIDAAGVILTMSRPPASAAVPALPGSGSALQNHLGGLGIVINPVASAPLNGGIYWMGHSFGAIQGTFNLAANSRLNKGVLIGGGATLMDILTNAPAFTAQVGGLLASLGITPGSADYLKFVNVAKWIADPADAINAAHYVLQAPLPDLLAGGAVAQAAKPVLAQMAMCDRTVPNAFNQELSGNIGAGPSGTGVAGSALSLFINPNNVDATQCPAGLSAGTAGAVTHSFITNRGVKITNPGTAAAGYADYTTVTDVSEQYLANQADQTAAAFLMDGTLPGFQIVAPINP